MILERIHLAIVQAVEQHGSLTAAAERLCVTQSALSHSVRKLEERLGTALWLRQGRSLRLTPAGQQVLILAQRVLPQLEQMETKLAQIAQALGHRLKHRVRRVQRRLLRHIGHSGVALGDDAPVVELGRAGNRLEQRRLASAVAANQAHALTGLE